VLDGVALNAWNTQELNIPTPYNEFVYHIIKAMEEKNDGLFE